MVNSPKTPKWDPKTVLTTTALTKAEVCFSPKELGPRPPVEARVRTGHQRGRRLPPKARMGNCAPELGESGMKGIFINARGLGSVGGSLGDLWDLGVGSPETWDFWGNDWGLLGQMGMQLKMF